MSVYSTSLRTQLIDPQFHSQDRCEFRLDNRGQSYMPTMRIGNLGLSKSANHNNEYNAGAGALGIISRIRLMDGNEELDSLRNVAQWMTFKNALKTNSQNTSVFNQLDGNRQGKVYGAPSGFLEMAAPKRIREGQADTLTTLDLRECFPFLNSISHLSTKLFENLRVVIEYVPTVKTTQGKMVQNIGGTHVADLVKTLPVLIVDEIEDEALVATLDRQMTSASWVSVMHDQANLPVVAKVTAYGEQAVQRVQLRINGFLNKTVSRMMIAKTYENPLHDLDGVQVRALGGNGSKALFKESINMRVNGGNIVAGNGLDSPAQIQGMLSDTWGSITTTPFANQQSVGTDQPYAAAGPLNTIGITPTVPSVLLEAPAGDGTGPQAGYEISNSSWIGLPIHSRVSDMSFDIGRTGTFSDGTNSSRGNFQALNIHFFAEVARGMTVSDGSYKIFDA